VRFQRFGSTTTIIEMLDSLISQEDADASKELANQFRKRGITLHLEKQCTKVEESGSELTVHFGDGETEEARASSLNTLNSSWIQRTVVLWCV
jgi:pyruvate/2-oxoglutarate dehydrogenase complex dihydrolipoamide dehydrogenase (E3) component